MAGLPVADIPLDYQVELERIQDFLAHAKAARVTNDEIDGNEDEDEDDELADDAALDILHMDLNGGARATGLKYKDALVGLVPRKWLACKWKLRLLLPATDSK